MPTWDQPRARWDRSVICKRLIYLQCDAEFGQWSDWKSFTLVGM